MRQTGLSWPCRMPRRWEQPWVGRGTCYYCYQGVSIYSRRSICQRSILAEAALPRRGGGVGGYQPGARTARAGGGSVADKGRRATMPARTNNRRPVVRRQGRMGRMARMGPSGARQARQAESRVCCRPDSARARAPLAASYRAAQGSTNASACWPARCRDEGRGLHPSPTEHPIR